MGINRELKGCWESRFFARGQNTSLQNNVKGKIKLPRGKVSGHHLPMITLGICKSTTTDVMFLWEIEERKEQENPEWGTVCRVAGCSLQNSRSWRKGGGRIF